MLRGINLGNHKKVSMPDLKTLYDTLHFKNIETYIQSGNVVFEWENADIKELEKTIAKSILEYYQFEVPVVIRTLETMQKLIAGNAFLQRKGLDEKQLHVTFLSEKPTAANLGKVNTFHYEPDEFFIIEDHIYILCPNGYGRTKLNNNFFESKLKVTATTRNWQTVNKLLEIATKQPYDPMTL